MKFSTVTACLAASLAPAAALSVFNGKVPAIKTNTDDSVPGESPLKFCSGDHSKDAVVIRRVDLSPNPPSPGEKLDIVATGTVKKTIEKGAYLDVTVKYGLITLVHKTFDLCEQIGNVDLECPIEAGDLKVVKSVDLPSAIPPGTYNVMADVYTLDDEPITCLTASVRFGPSSFIGGDL